MLKLVFDRFFQIYYIRKLSYFVSHVSQTVTWGVVVVKTTKSKILQTFA